MAANDVDLVKVILATAKEQTADDASFALALALDVVTTASMFKVPLAGCVRLFEAILELEARGEKH